MGTTDQKAIQQNRKTLKDYFRAGSQPTSAQFEQLIESTLNMLDDGFSCSRENGVEFSVKGDNDRLLSLFRKSQQMGDPDWAITCRNQDGNLSFVNAKDASHNNSTGSAGSQDKEILTLTNESMVGINNVDPAFQLDVKGTVRSDGRFGRTGQVSADGKPHPITGTLHGCHALEVVAGVGFKKTGRYGMIHAIAMNAFNPTGWLNLFGSPKKIRCSHSWYLSRADRIKLNWVAVKDDQDSHAYRLELKTLRDYGDDVQVRYSVTELWHYPFMDDTLTSTDQDKA
jgi:hypothetical protein